MCGRYTIAKPERIIVAFEPVAGNCESGKPRYNISPMQKVPAVLVRDERRALAECQWGFVPHWAEDPAVGNRMINARSETLAEKPSFRTAFAHGRCLIPADGFYEWQRIGSEKRPHYIRMVDGSLFAFAGLYSVWKGGPAKSGGGAADSLLSCCIVTTSANDLMRPIHDRMPVILAKGCWDPWIDPANTDVAALKAMFRPFDPGLMTEYPVSRHVNSPANDDDRCIAPESRGGVDFSLT